MNEHIMNKRKIIVLEKYLQERRLDNIQRAILKYYENEKNKIISQEMTNTSQSNRFLKR